MPDKCKKSTAARAISQLRRLLTKWGWSFVAREDGSLRGLVDGKNCQWHWLARDNGDGRFLLFFGYCPVFVSPERRAAAAEYLARANWGLFFGNFEMDFSDGQVCFRTSIPLGAGGASPTALEDLTAANCAIMDRYLPGLLAVALGAAAPEAALRQAEDPAPSSQESPAAAVGQHPSAESGAKDCDVLERRSRFLAGEN